MANTIIDKDTEKELNYWQLSNHPKYKKIREQPLAKKPGRLDQGAGICVDGTDTMFFISNYQVPRDQIKMWHMDAS